MQHERQEKAEAEEPVPVGDTESGRVETEDDPAGDRRAAGEAEAGEDENTGDEAPTEEELVKWKELAMRATADLDNYRKRMAREKAESLRYANQELLEELLPVLDNFAMGLQAASADQDSMIFRGMAMVKKQLDEFLRSQGVEEIPAEGEMFDPNVHEAVSQEESGEAEEGRVLRVVRRGYRMHDRLLRPANVVVAKEPEAEESSGEEGDDN